MLQTDLFEIKSNIKTIRVFLSNMLKEVSITDLYVLNGLVIPANLLSNHHKNIDFIFIAKEKGQKKYSVEELEIEVIENTMAKH